MSAGRPRLVATDLDGTLLRDDLTVSARTVAALRAADATGATVVLVTGRPPRAMRPIAAAVGHTGLAICANGAIVYDLRLDEVIESRPFGPSAAGRVVAALQAALPGATFATETTEGFAQEPAYPTHPLDVFAEASPRRASPRRAVIDELVAEAVVKVLVHHADLGPDELLASAREVADDLAELTHSSTIGLLEVSARGVTKATTLALLARERGIDAADVVAFGDMPNDLAMLAWAGRSYAMANAHPDVLAAVDDRAPSNDDDGVAQVLERLLGPESS